MQFNSTTAKNGILQNCESLAGLGDGGITGNATLLLKFTGWVNEAYHKVARAILTVDKQWRWDDVNWTGDQAQAVATATLQDGVRGYILPRATNTAHGSTLWKVYRVRVKDLDGNWYDLEPLSPDENETDGGSGKPTRYRLLGNAVRLSDPPADGVVTLAQGIQVWFQREFDLFTSTDTTQEPGFLSSYHMLLAYDATASFLLPTDQAKAAGYLALFNAGLQELKESYAQRLDDPKSNRRLEPKVEDTK